MNMQTVLQTRKWRLCLDFRADGKICICCLNLRAAGARLQTLPEPPPRRRGARSRLPMHACGPPRHGAPPSASQSARASHPPARCWPLVMPHADFSQRSNTSRCPASSVATFWVSHEGILSAHAGQHVFERCLPSISAHLRTTVPGAVRENRCSEVAGLQSGMHQRQQRVAGGQVAAQCGRILAKLALRLGRPRRLQLTVPPVELRMWSGLRFGQK